ncbi:MAG: hypothetical protein H2172_08420 [Opitutus sp.]|nr:hypothetical protein [Opitutus sp.]MCS6246569.1 hypothetical protein [Opitutus sp.]MCS6272746.1 hypothetical protein [Opitutus sp.]MCS6276378.1 hypothetical protein [Opitutus sp.]MCS6301974.1 hypothetical protein [Opitutus sp.]
MSFAHPARLTTPRTDCGLSLGELLTVTTPNGIRAAGVDGGARAFKAGSLTSGNSTS